MAFLRIGRKSSYTPSLRSDLRDAKPRQPEPKPAEEQLQPAPNPPEQQVKEAHRPITAYERLVQAAARVSDLEGRLKDANKAVVDLNARLAASREAAVEAALQGKEIHYSAFLEVEIRSAQGRERIFEEALARAKASLRDAEAESLRAGQVEQDETFAKTLKELMGHAAKMAECHKRLRELHLSSGGRYRLELFWPAFDSQDHYARWLGVATDFISRVKEQKDDHTKGAGYDQGADEQGAANHQSHGADADAHKAEDAGTISVT